MASNSVAEPKTLKFVRMPSIEEAFDRAEELLEDLPVDELTYEEFAENFWSYVRDRRWTAGKIVGVTIIWRLHFPMTELLPLSTSWRVSTPSRVVDMGARDTKGEKRR